MRRSGNTIKYNNMEYQLFIDLKSIRLRRKVYLNDILIKFCTLNYKVPVEINHGRKQFFLRMSQSLGINMIFISIFY